jgi:hypothetical protein
MKKSTTSLKALLLIICLLCTVNVLFAENDPPIAEAGQNQTICAETSATLIATGGTSYLWSTSDENDTIVVSPTSTTKYFVTVSKDGSDAVDSVVITVAQNPTANISGNNTIYKGSADTLTASGGVSYIWSNNATDSQIIVSPENTDLYKVTVTNEAGCTATDEFMVIVNELPPPTHYFYSICLGQSVTLTAPEGASYLWSTGDTTATAVVSPDTTLTFLVTITKEDESTMVDSFTVSLKPNPTVEAGEDVTVQLPGTFVSLTASGSGTEPLEFVWNNDMKGATIQVMPFSTKTFEVVIYDKTGCKSTDNVTVTVSRNFPETNFYSICKGQSATLKAPGGKRWTWNTGDTTAAIVVSPGETEIYSVAFQDYYDNDSIVTKTDSFLVILRPSPTVNLGNDTIVQFLASEQITLTAQVTSLFPETLKYDWFKDFGSLDEVYSNTDSIVVPSYPSKYTVYVSDRTGCKATDEINIKVEDLKRSKRFDYSICSGQSVTLTPPRCMEYVWSTGDSTSSIVVAPIELKSYYVSVTDEKNFISVDTFVIKVRPSPTVNAGADVTVQNPATQVTLVATYPQAPGLKLEWSNGIWADSIQVAPLKTTEYTVTVKNETGCSASDNVTITVGSSESNYWQANNCIISPIHGICKVGIGTDSIPNDFILAIKGKTIASDEITIKLFEEWQWPDYVFSKDYKLTKLDEIEKYLTKNKHLPGIPSSDEIKKDGLGLAEMNTLLLKKIEELTLYQIELNKQIIDLNKKVEALETKQQK